MLNCRAQQESWLGITMLVGLGVLPTHPSFRRPGDTHGVTRPRQAGPGSSDRPWCKLDLHLAPEEDQLLTKQRIFDEKVRLGTGKIGEGSRKQRATSWPRPLEQVPMDPTKAASERAYERDEQT